MARIRLTQLFPFLIPLRQWQRRLFFYLAMRFDKNKYAKSREAFFPYTLTESTMPLINKESGQDIQYQYNKVHNLRLSSAAVDKTVIRPGETFSFWQLVRHAEKQEKYKDGLVLVDGRIQASAGGGLCQLSDLLFWLFLHTPLTITERHPHGVKAFPTPDVPPGTDATVYEGWKDLKVRNDTNDELQVQITLDEEYIYGFIRVKEEPLFRYEVLTRDLHYYREEEQNWEQVSVYRQKYSRINGDLVSDIRLYENKTLVTYDLSGEIAADSGKPPEKEDIG